MKTQDYLQLSRAHTCEQPYPADDSNTYIRREYWEESRNNEPRSTKCAKYMGALTFYVVMSAGSIAGNNVVNGIQEGKERVAHDHAKIHQVYEYDGNDEPFETHATVVMTGLGTKNATATAETLLAHQEVGSVYALEYSNKDLNTEDIAQSIIDETERNNITHLSFDGYSMGGPIALDVATHIRHKKPELDVVSVVLNSSPIGENSLTDRSANSIRIMERILSLHNDLVYYENGRIAIELVARNEHYLSEIGRDDTAGFKMHTLSEYSYEGVRYRLDYESLRHELAQIHEKMQHPNVADANLINNQASILELDFSKKIQELDSTTLIVYTRSASAHEDHVVNVETSESNVRKSLREKNQPHKILREYIQHANPAERRDEYDRMIRAKIQPDVIYYLQAEMRDDAVTFGETAAMLAQAQEMSGNTRKDQPSR